MKFYFVEGTRFSKYYVWASAVIYFLNGMVLALSEEVDIISGIIIQLALLLILISFGYITKLIKTVEVKA